LKARAASIILLVSCLALVAPAIAQNDLYDNGPVNGQDVGWTINFGFSVSDSITCCKVLGDEPSVNETVTGLAVWAWLIPGDTLSSVEVQLGTSQFGNNLFDGTVNLTPSDCFSNNFGYNVCMESATFNGPTLSANTTAWITLLNANVPSGDPVYWDQNSGVGCTSPGCPSQAQENTIGTIPSEAFTIFGSGGTTSTTGTTPEPTTFLMLGSGIVGLAGILRHKIKL
jgi:hypothetical protein